MATPQQQSGLVRHYLCPKCNQPWQPDAYDPHNPRAARLYFKDADGMVAGMDVITGGKRCPSCRGRR